MESFTDVELKMLDEALVLLAKDLRANESEYTREEVKAIHFLYGSVYLEEKKREDEF